MEKKPVKKLEDWEREARECGVDYGTYRGLVTVFGKTKEEIKAQLVGRDQNGVEIYEGDRLFRNDGEIFIAKIVGYVECEDEEELQGIYVEPERFRVKELVA